MLTINALSWVPISHSWETIQSLLEGAIVGAASRGETKASEELLEEHEHYTPLMMIPSGNPKEVLDLPVHPYDTGPRAPE